MPVVISHATGNEFFRAAAAGLQKAGLLQAIYTSLATFPGSFPDKLAGLNLLANLRRRSMYTALKPYTNLHPWKEAARLIAVKTGWQKLVQHETGLFSVDAVYKSLDAYVARKLKRERAKGANAVYAYEDGACYSFRAAKALEYACLYDLPIGYWRTMHRLLNEEADKNPAWASIVGGLSDSVKKLERKDEEIQLADAIIVASRFTAASLEDYPGKTAPVYIVPYGFAPVTEKKYRPLKKGETIKLLFVGGLSQRKGLSYLFEAVKNFGKNISLTIIGQGNIKNCKPLQDCLGKCNWIETLPHNGVLQQMQAHDVLVLPSLFEGFGQVITEAMSRGTPVITTERTAGPDIIEHNVNGWLVKAGSSTALQSQLEDILQNPDIIETVGKKAAETALQRPWHVYGEELASCIKNISGQASS